MKHEHKQRIIEILNEYGSLIGVDSRETDSLVHELNGNKKERSLDDKIDDIIDKVYFTTGISFEEMKKPCRNREIVIARQVAMYKLRTELGEVMTWLRISRIFNRDHATAIHAYKMVSNGIEMNDPLFLDILNGYESADLIAA